MESIIKIVKEETPDQPWDHLTFHLKDGGDGAGSMPSLRSKKKPGVENENNNNETADDEESDDEDEAEHIFQYGLIPLKLVRNYNCHQDILWQNKLPNSFRSLRPIYLI